MTDPFVGGPVDPRKVEIERADDEIAALGEAIRSASRSLRNV